MRKPVCLAVIGISIVVSAVSLGVTLTRFIDLRAYSPGGTAQAAATPAGRTVPAAPAEEWNNLFAPGHGMKMASRLPAVDAMAASRAPRASFILVGTIGSSNPSSRRAILWADGMKEPKAFREKEEVEPGAFLASVERDKAWITRGTEREKLEILPVGSRGRLAATAGPAAVSSPAAPPAVASGGHSPAFPPGAAPRFVPEQPSPGGTQESGGPKASGLDADGESSASIRDRIRRLRGNRR